MRCVVNPAGLHTSPCIQARQPLPAPQAGVFNGEIAPVEVKGKKGKEAMTADEHPRLNSTLADLQKLKPVFKVRPRPYLGPI